MTRKRGVSSSVCLCLLDTPKTLFPSGLVQEVRKEMIVSVHVLFLRLSQSFKLIPALSLSFYLLQRLPSVPFLSARGFPTVSASSISTIKTKQRETDKRQRICTSRGCDRQSQGGRLRGRSKCCSLTLRGFRQGLGHWRRRSCPVFQPAAEFRSNSKLFLATTTKRQIDGNQLVQSIADKQSYCHCSCFASFLDRLNCLRFLLFLGSISESDANRVGGLRQNSNRTGPLLISHTGAVPRLERPFPPLKRLGRIRPFVS